MLIPTNRKFSDTWILTAIRFLVVQVTPHKVINFCKERKKSCLQCLLIKPDSHFFGFPNRIIRTSHSNRMHESHLNVKHISKRRALSTCAKSKGVTNTGKKNLCKTMTNAWQRKKSCKLCCWETFFVSPFRIYPQLSLNPVLSCFRGEKSFACEQITEMVTFVSLSHSRCYEDIFLPSFSPSFGLKRELLLFQNKNKLCSLTCGGWFTRFLRGDATPKKVLSRPVRHRCWLLGVGSLDFWGSNPEESPDTLPRPVRHRCWLRI